MALYLIMLGAPGAGKGTQADLLCRKYGLAKVASGELFREHLQQETELGRLAKS
ncbi:MAG: adenylate kinase, partial [Chloroflexota bacterium]